MVFKFLSSLALCTGKHTTKKHYCQADSLYTLTLTDFHVKKGLIMCKYCNFCGSFVTLQVQQGLHLNHLLSLTVPAYKFLAFSNSIADGAQRWREHVEILRSSILTSARSKEANRTDEGLVLHQQICNLLKLSMPFLNLSQTTNLN